MWNFKYPRFLWQKNVFFASFFILLKNDFLIFLLVFIMFLIDQYFQKDYIVKYNVKCLAYFLSDICESKTSYAIWTHHSHIINTYPHYICESKTSYAIWTHHSHIINTYPHYNCESKTSYAIWTHHSHIINTYPHLVIICRTYSPLIQKTLEQSVLTKLTKYIYSFLNTE